MSSTTAQTGFAMLLVLILVAVSVILGVSYLSVASLQVEVSQNFERLVQARYLAESGLEHGLYILRFLPERFDEASQHGLGPFYVEGQEHGYYVSASRDPDNPRRYRVQSRAGIGAVERTCSADVYRVSCPTVGLKHGAIVAAGSVWTPWGLNLQGNFHVNGGLTNWAAVGGNASSTGYLWDPCHRITGTITANAPQISLPATTVDQYVKYVLGGLKCKAVKCKDKDIYQDSSLANGAVVTAKNVGGVVYLKPHKSDTVVLHDNLNFVGTFVIKGHIRLEGRNITLTAVDGFPAIVATGSLKVTREAKNVRVNGLVVADQGIVPDDKWSAEGSSVVISGAVTSRMTGFAPNLGGRHQVEYLEHRADIYDFSVPPKQRIPVVKVLAWYD